MNKDQFERVALVVIIASLLFVPTQFCNGFRCISAGWNFIFTTDYSVDFIKLIIEELIIGLLLFYLWRNKSKIKTKKISIKPQFWPNVWKNTKKVWYGLAIIFAGRLGAMLGFAIQGFIPPFISAIIGALIAAYLTSTLIRFIAIKFYKSDIHSAYFDEGKLFTSTKKFFWILVCVFIALPFIANYNEFKKIDNKIVDFDPITNLFSSNYTFDNLKIKLGDSKNDVLNSLGYPVSVYEGKIFLPKEFAKDFINNPNNHKMMIWKYEMPNHVITINPNPFLADFLDDKVKFILCEHKDGQFVDPDDTYCPYLGIDLFDNQEKVIDKFGGYSVPAAEAVGTVKYFQYSDLGVTFTIKDGQVIAIEIYKPFKK